MIENLFGIGALLILLRIAYNMGRRRGQREAYIHCDIGFILRLRLMKQMMDNWLTDAAFGRTQQTEYTMVVNGQVIVHGTTMEVAQRSIEVGELIERVEKIYPELATS